MKRSIAALVAACIALGLFVIGLVMNNQANFAHTQVRQQLAAQQITFEPVSALAANQKNIRCLAANANKPLLSGSQAECYADHQIALDLDSIFGKKTYSQLSARARQAACAAAVTAAKDPTNPKLPALQAAAAKAEAPAGVAFQAETLRGMLLTTYAFDHMGDLAATTGTALFIASGLLLLVAIGLAIFAATTKESADATA
jgi:hypothetical protein